MMIGHPMLDLVDGMVRLVALLLSVNNQIVFFLLTSYGIKHFVFLFVTEF
jgi:hypothetical protein